MADNKISVNDFVTKVLSLETLESREAYVNTVIKTRYLDFAEKDYWTKKIIESSSYKRDKDGKQTDKIEINSNQRYFMYAITIVTAYTNLKFTNNNASLDEFDDLEKNGLINMICKCIGDEEIGRFNKMLDNALSDFKANHLEPSSYIDGVVDKLFSAGDSLMDGLGKLLGSVNSDDLQTILNSLPSLTKK